MAAGVFGFDELLLDDDEAEKLETSIEQVLALYEHEVNPAALAWLGLGGVLIMVYGPRIHAIRKKLKEEAQQAPGAHKVVPFAAPAPRPAQAAAAPAAAAPSAAASSGPTGTPQDMFGTGYSAALQDPL